MARMMWEAVVKHEGLGKLRVIKGSDKNIVEQKAYLQELAWEEQWQKKLKAEDKKLKREQAAREKDEKKQLAIEKSEEAREVIRSIEQVLHYTLSIDDTIDWESLKDTSKFGKPTPSKPQLKPTPQKPKESDPNYQPILNLLDKVISLKKEKKIIEAKEKFYNDHRQWEKNKQKIEEENKQLIIEYKNAVKKWEHEKTVFYAKQKQNNLAIEQKKKDYFSGRPETIIDYCDMVLANSKYPGNFPQEFDLNFDPETKILIVEYALPAPDHLPTLKEIRYIQSRDEFSESHLSNIAQKKLYDDLLYQITLRTIHELYEADIIQAIVSIVFNGWVKAIDKATGQETNTCVMSVQAGREQFISINLAMVDPKECFKKLKGVGSSKLHGLVAIAPIMHISRKDKRFVTSIDVSHELDESVNIAAMDWEEFEHLVREIFEKEFTQSGGEVKITRASRDGGVDAVAFDPDPIRGGKIVIQAKRYTNVVGVSAVRDLYGTVVNEGAIKGILVTTAKYGPDAYEFAKDKPLTLLDGSNLLHLLERHGVKAKIDLKEAKNILANK